MNGSLQRKGKIWYVVTYMLTGEEGNVKKPKWISTGLEDKKEAEKKMAEIIVNNNSRPVFHTKEMLFVELFQDWLKKYIVELVEETTYETYEYQARHIVEYFEINKIKLNQLRTIDIEKFLLVYKNGKNLSAKKYSSNYLKKLYSNIYGALEYARKKLHIITFNPAIDVERKIFDDDICEEEENDLKFVGENFLELDELQRLIKMSIDTYLEAPIILGGFYGLRRGEVLGLRWSDIDFEKKKIYIRKNRVRIKTQKVKSPKTKSSRRTLELLPVTEKYLLELKAKQIANSKIIPGPGCEDDYVCRSIANEPLSASTLNHGFSRLIEKNNFKPITFHGLRHTSVAYMLQIGASYKEIQIRLGHAQFQTTMDIYGHVFDKAQKSSADKINALLVI